MIGDRGTGLSGGQRARVSLARSLYRTADIYILDEPLGAVDAKTGTHIFKRAIKQFLKDKTVILATHQVQFLYQADNVILLQNGRIRAQGTLKQILDQGIALTDITEEDAALKRRVQLQSSDEKEENVDRALSRSSERVSSSASTDTLSIIQVLNESATEFKENIKGNVGFSMYMEFFRSGSQSYILLLAFLLFCCGTQSLYVICDWWLSRWLALEEITNVTSTREYHPKKVLSDRYDWRVFLGLTIGCLFVSIIRAIFTASLVINSSRVLHNRMFYKILKAPLYFFHKTPIGAIMNRFSRDLSIMDDILPSVFQDSFEYSLLVIGMIIYIAIINYYTLIIVIPYIAFIFLMRQLYIRCGQDVKRIEAIGRTPIFSHLNAVMSGLPTIRALQMQNRLQDEFEAHLDHASRTYNLHLVTQRWFQLRVEIFSVIFITVASIIFIFLNTTTSSAQIGLSLSYAIMIMNLAQWAIRQTADFSTLMTSVERILEYSKLEDEGQPENPTVPPNDWPNRGELLLRNTSFRYSPNTPVVLKCDFLEIKPGDKVGIVGRTGAGKSSFFNMLLRLGEVEGEVELDGIDLSRMKLKRLRSAISLIPQEPVFFTGSLRKNLDPFDEYSDHLIWDALDQVEMREYFVQKGLEMHLAEQGSNLSVGQRQLLCLARALLRKCRVMLVDEATANVDKETDNKIQLTTRKKLSDQTVITVAHRLNTIVDCDYVLVIDNGKIVENGRPIDLLCNEHSAFRKLASEAGQAEVSKLRALIKA